MLEQCQNLVQLLLHNLNRRPNKQALYVKRQGLYTPITYQEFFENVKWMALGLSQLGVGENDFVALISGNRPEWAFSDLGIMSIGAVNVPIYPTLTPSEIKYILQDCNAKVVIVENEQHLEKVLQIVAECGSVQHIITLDRHLRNANVMCQAFDDVVALGKQSTSKAYEEYLAHLDRIRPEHLASVVYTSGTTGEPKGVMLTHGNFLANIRDITLALPISDTDVVLSFLPLSHVFERTTGYYCVVAVGGSIYYAESIDTVRGNMMEAKPTIVISVPRLYEKMQGRILDAMLGPRLVLFNWATRVSQRYHHQNRGRTISVGVRLQYAIANRLVLKKVREKTGGRLRFFVSGGAPLSKEVARFFENLGLLIIEGYGLTETAPVICCNRLDHYKLVTVGKVLASQEIRLGDDGELQVKGPNIMAGYLNRPDRTAEVIDAEGWFHTGDIAEIDADGFVKIIDRKKELIVLSNGKKVAPQLVEMKLMSSEFIAQAIVVGDNRNFISALIVPNFDRIKKADPSATAMAFLTPIIHKKMAELANFEQVKKFVILDHEFSIEAGELTPSLKLRRKIINQKYGHLIDPLYAGSQAVQD